MDFFGKQIGDDGISKLCLKLSSDVESKIPLPRSFELGKCALTDGGIVTLAALLQNSWSRGYGTVESIGLAKNRMSAVETAALFSIPCKAPTEVCSGLRITFR